MITEPITGTGFFVNREDPPGSFYATVTFQGQVSDLQDPVSALTVEWESNETITILSQTKDDATGEVTMTARVYLNSGDTSTRHTITLRVTDTDMNVTEFEVDIFVYTLT